MKKLTAGIFATLLAVVSAGDANAKIASQAYVDQEVGAVKATVTEVQENVTNVTEQVTQVTEQVTEITNPDTGLAAVVGNAEGGLVKDVADLGTEVEGLGTDIGNTESLATTSKEVVGAINEVEGRVDTAEGEIDALQTTVAGKADQTALTSGLALKENTANKSTSAQYEADINSDIKFPTVKAVATAIEEATSDIATNTDYQALKTTVEGKQDKLSGAQMNAVNSGITADKVSTYDGYAATIATKANTADLGALATKDTVGTADIDAKAVTTEKLADGIVTSLGKADTALQPGALSDYQTKTQADAAYAVKTLENQVGVVSAENMHTTASTVVTAIAEVSDEVGDAQQAATTAQGEVDALEAVVNNETTGLAAAHTAIDTVKSSVGEIQSDLAQMPTNTTIGTLTELKTDVKTNLVGAINEVNTNADSAASAAAAADDKADAAQSAADAAQKTADAAIPKPAGSCKEPGATCVLVYNGTSYSWEDIARATEE